MDYVQALKQSFNAQEDRELRARKRAHRAQSYRESLSDAVAIENQRFLNRHAYVWSFDEENEGSSRKIIGHAGASAAAYVSEVLSEYDIQGTVLARCTGMDRAAGHGAHGIVDGTITVDAEITPIRGMTQVLEIPVTVKNGYLLRPGIAYLHGSPMVLAQSALDDVMREAVIDDEVKPDRKHMYSPGGRTAAKRSAPPFGQSKREYEQAKKHYEQDTKSEEEKAKERRKRRQKERETDSGWRFSEKKGSMVRLAVEITIPDTGEVLPEGSRAFVAGAVDDLLVLKHECGSDVLIHPAHLV